MDMQWVMCGVNMYIHVCVRSPAWLRIEGQCRGVLRGHATTMRHNIETEASQNLKVRYIEVR